MTTPRRPTDAEFETLAAAHDGTQGCQDMEAEARRARSGEEQAGRERDEARAWAAKVEAAFSDAQRELSAILGRAPDEKLDDAARRVVAERESLHAVARQAARQLGDEGAARLRAECERDALERQIDEFALAIGYGAQPPGQSGVERPSLAYIADLIKDERQEHTEAREFQTWAAEALDQWREGEDHMGPLDDALTAALDELEAKRADVERLKAQIDRMRQRIQELEEHHG